MYNHLPTFSYSTYSFLSSSLSLSLSLSLTHSSLFPLFLSPLSHSLACSALHTLHHTLTNYVKENKAEQVPTLKSYTWSKIGKHSTTKTELYKITIYVYRSLFKSCVCVHVRAYVSFLFSPVRMVTHLAILALYARNIHMYVCTRPAMCIRHPS